MYGFPRFYFRKYTITVLCGLCVLVMWKYSPGFPSPNLSARGEVDDFQSRISKLQSECQRLQKSSGEQEILNADSLRPASFVDNVFINKKHGLLYCSIAKIGCTFWKRVFKVLDETNPGKLHLFDIKGPNIHFNIPDSMTLINTTQEQFQTMLATYTKFIFVRDPFSRLFSGYVDKILVPTVVQTGAVKFFIATNLTTTSKLPCNRKVSFPDFSSLLYDAIVKKGYSNQHFLMISTQCKPCKINYNIVGRMETFMTDVRKVLHTAHIDISEVTGGIEDIDTVNDVGIIKDVIERVWSYYLSRSDGCLSHLETAQRLWSHLQIRGLISKTIQLPLSQGKDSVFTLESYISAAVEAYEHSEPRHIRMRQRGEAMMEAYSLVPRETLEKLSQLFAEDCSLFGYSCDVDRFLLNRNAPQFYFKNFQ